MLRLPNWIEAALRMSLKVSEAVFLIGKMEEMGEVVRGEVVKLQRYGKSDCFWLVRVSTTLIFSTFSPASSCTGEARNSTTNALITMRFC